MCNTTSELDVEHPRGPHRVQHVQHLFNTYLLPFPGVEQPQTRFFAAAGALAVISKHPWFISVPLGYSICPLSGRSTSAPVYERLMSYVEPLGLSVMVYVNAILVAAVRQLCNSCAAVVQQLCNTSICTSVSQYLTCATPGLEHVLCMFNSSRALFIVEPGCLIRVVA